MPLDAITGKRGRRGIKDTPPSCVQYNSFQLPNSRSRIPALVASASLTPQTESPVGVEFSDQGVACDADGEAGKEWLEV